MSSQFKQTHFVHSVSPAHMGNQGFLHQDHHLHLAFPDNSLVRGGPVFQQNHVPVLGQSRLSDFGPRPLWKPGW